MKKQVPSLLLAGLIGGVAVWLAVTCLATGYGLSRVPELSAVFLPLGAGLTVLYRTKRGRLWFWLIPLLFAALLVWPALRTAFKSVGLTILVRINSGYQWFARLPSVVSPPSATQTTLAMGYLGLWALWLESRGLSRGGLLLTLYPPVGVVALTFVLIDTTPRQDALLALTGVLILLLLTDYLHRREPELRWKALLALVLPVALLIAGLSQIFPEKTYRKRPLETAIAERLVQLREAFEASALPGVFLPLTEPDLRDLSDLRSAPDSTRTVLSVKTNYGGRIYLRGKAYAKYNGTVWAVDAETDWDPSLLFYEIEVSKGVYSYSVPINSVLAEMQISTVGVHDVIYTPYFLVEAPETAVPVSDAFWRNDEGLSKYTLRYTPLNVFQLAAPQEVREAYEAAVSQTYTMLSEDTRAALQEWWRNLPPETDEFPIAWYEDASPEDGSTVISGVGPGEIDSWTDTSVGPVFSSIVPDWPMQTVEPKPVPRSEHPTPWELCKEVSKSARYDRDPETFPGGQDFAVWFLNEAESGYCTHFATALTALLRAYGYPARFVTGYLTETKPGAVTDVAVKDAHAWVEYYEPGNGWVVLDPTPASDEAETRPGEGETRPTFTAGTAPETTELPTLPDRTEEPRTTAAPQTETVPTQTEPDAGGTAEKTSLRWLRWFALLPALALVLWLRRKLAQVLRQRKLRRAAPNVRLCLLYRRYEKLCRLAKAKPSDDCYALAQKARFSQHETTPEELRVMTAAIADAEARLAARGFFPKLFYRYISAVI